MIDIDALTDTAIRTSVVSTCKKGLFSMDITSMEFYFTFFFSRNTYRWFMWPFYVLFGTVYVRTAIIFLRRRNEINK